MAADDGRKKGAHLFQQQQSHQMTRLVTAAAALLCSIGLFVLVTAESSNYGTTFTTTTQGQFDANKDCAAADAPQTQNSHKKSSLHQEKKFHSKTVKPKNTDIDDKEERLLHHAGQCALYLAPSSLPHAGLGLFAGSAVPARTSLNAALLPYPQPASNSSRPRQRIRNDSMLAVRRVLRS